MPPNNGNNEDRWEDFQPLPYLPEKTTINAKPNIAWVAANGANVLLEKLDSITLYRILQNVFFPEVIVIWNMFSFK